MFKFIEAGSRDKICWGLGWRENEELMFNGYRISVKQNAKRFILWMVTVA